MDVVFRAKGFPLNEQLKEYVSQKLGRLSRYLPLVKEVMVEVEGEGKADQQFAVQVTVNANGTFLRAQERGPQLKVALDAAVDALARQVRRYKERLYRSRRRAKESLRTLSPLPPLAADREVASSRVVKVKRFALKPMTQAEAIEQMELLGHNFFLFQDAGRGGYALLYRRQDGNYGLIIPEPA